MKADCPQTKTEHTQIRHALRTDRISLTPTGGEEDAISVTSQERYHKI